MTCGELETCTHEAAVLGRKEADGEGRKPVTVGWWGGYEGVGATARDGREVTVPHAVGFVLAGDECGLGG